MFKNLISLYAVASFMSPFIQAEAKEKPVDVPEKETAVQTVEKGSNKKDKVKSLQQLQRDRIDNETFRNWIIFARKAEGVFPFAYKDSNNNPTCGIGYFICPSGRAPTKAEVSKIPFYKNGKLMSDSEKISYIQGMRSHSRGYESACKYAQRMGITLKDEDLEKLTWEKTRTIFPLVRPKFEERFNLVYEKQPLEARILMDDMIFNYGFKALKFKKTWNAYKRGDFATMKKEIVKNQPNKDRNKARLLLIDILEARTKGLDIEKQVDGLAKLDIKMPDVMTAAQERNAMLAANSNRKTGRLTALLSQSAAHAEDTPLVPGMSTLVSNMSALENSPLKKALKSGKLNNTRPPLKPGSYRS